MEMGGEKLVDAERLGGLKQPVLTPNCTNLYIYLPPPPKEKKQSSDSHLFLLRPRPARIKKGGGWARTKSGVGIDDQAAWLLCD